MKSSKVLATLALGLSAAIYSCGSENDDVAGVESMQAAASSASQGEDFDLAGNGAPSGSHFNLNLIGVPKGKSASLSGGSGRRIFVPLAGKTKILLQEGATFEVLDANGTDGSAQFQLPNPDANNDGVTEYSVFARALGTPGGQGSLVTCAIDPTSGEEICGTETLTLTRSKGKSTFSNVSAELLFITVDLDGDGVVERLPLFDDRLQDFFWSFDNNGLKLVQLRFYPIATDVNQ